MATLAERFWIGSAPQGPELDKYVASHAVDMAGDPFSGGDLFVVVDTRDMPDGHKMLAGTT